MVYEWKRGNFEALRGNCAEAADLLERAESNARLNIQDSGHLLRMGLEAFAKAVLMENPSLRDGLRSDDLADKLNMLADHSAIPRLPRQRGIRYIDDGKQVKRDVEGLDFIRDFGNLGSHYEMVRYPLPNYTNTLLALKLAHSLLCQHYGISQVRFDEAAMPIGNYHICDCACPADNALSGCDMEYTGVELDGAGQPAFYVIIRQYYEHAADETFLLRNYDANRTLVCRHRRQRPKGIAATIEQLSHTDGGDQFTPYYIIAYRFNRRPIALTTKYLRMLTMRQRHQLCGDLIDTMSTLHKAAKPVYLRMLSYESVYICEEDNECIPYLTKFDFAKVPDSSTVILQMSRRSSGIQEVRRRKYLAPEWNDALLKTDPDWEKIDIYALGVLLGDILAGEIRANVVDPYDLEDVSDDICEVVSLMTAELPSDRCDLDYALLAFDREM